jgi:hypothetical protein
VYAGAFCFSVGFSILYFAVGHLGFRDPVVHGDYFLKPVMDYKRVLIPVKQGSD